MTTMTGPFRSLWASLLLAALSASGCGGSASALATDPPPPPPMGKTISVPASPAPSGAAAPAAGTAAADQKWPYQFLKSKTEVKGTKGYTMDLYAYSGELDPATLKAFCQERKGASSTTGGYSVVIFDDAANAKFPTTPLAAEYDSDFEQLQHIRAIYTFLKVNGFSEVRYHPKNIYDQIPMRQKI